MYMRAITAVLLFALLSCQVSTKGPDWNKSVAERISGIEINEFRGLEMEYTPGRKSIIRGTLDSVMFTVGLDRKLRIINDVKNLIPIGRPFEQWVDERYIRTFPLEDDELAIATDLIELVKNGIWKLKVDNEGNVSGEIWDNNAGTFVRFETKIREKKNEVSIAGFTPESKHKTVLSIPVQFSVGERTVTTYDGYIHGDYYVVRHYGGKKDTITMDCRLIPVRDSVAFENLSKDEQVESMIKRRIPLDKNEKNMIEAGIRLLNRYGWTYLTVKGKTITAVTDKTDTV